MQHSDRMPYAGPAGTAVGDIAAMPTRADIEEVVAAAVRAPSIHNTQPWRWVSHDGVLDVRADRDRQLHVADRDGHSLLISDGAAVELTELAFRARGWTVDTALLPDPRDPDLLARIRPTRREVPDGTAATRLAAALARRSDRRPFGGGALDPVLVERLRQAGTTHDVLVHFPRGIDEMTALKVAVSHADRFERDDPAYAAELARWVRPDDSNPDGVPTSAIPEVPAGRSRHTDIPLRDFEAGVAGGQLIEAGVDEAPIIAVIFTVLDDDRERLRAGRAMMRLMVQAEMEGVATCPLSQSVDLLAFRTRLRALMSWDGHPQMMLRLGPRPPGTPPPLTSRRPAASVLTFA